MLCSNQTAKFSSLKGSIKPFDGWISKYYNSKMPIQAMSYSTKSNNETWFLSAVSKSDKIPIVSLCDNNIEVNGSKVMELEIVRNSSNQMIAAIGS